jgi:hypothetical protein
MKTGIWKDSVTAKLKAASKEMEDGYSPTPAAWRQGHDTKKLD